MKNEPKLSAFGWLIILAIFAGIFYWFSLPESIEETTINILNIFSKSFILFLILLVHSAALYNKQSHLAIYSNIMTLVLVSETFIFNSEALNSSTSNSVWVLGFSALFVGVVSGAIACIYLCNYITELVNPKTGKWQALKDSLAQNPFTKLMFKQHKQEKPVEKVKI